ncbi:hypothetical protein ABW19_dt0201908 [Dactylella cylindrospora]|nr:hypothetical protein ABW19_dt0201908 [Dactylella cylindrospora]
MKLLTILSLLTAATNAGVVKRDIEVAVAAHAPITPAQIAARPAGVQNTLSLGVATDCTVSIPFLNIDAANVAAKTSWPDYSAPRVMVAVDGVNIYSKGVLLDTGSTGFTIGKDRWTGTFGKDWATTPKVTPGFKYLSSSDRLYQGYWVDVELTFKDASYNPRLKARFPVLVYDTVVICSQPPDEDGNCLDENPGSDTDLSGAYLGIGYGRRENNNVQMTPDKNPFLNVVSIWRPNGSPATCTYRNGYKITKTAITWGLTDANLAGYNHHVLAKFSTEDMDWAMAPVCLGVNALPCRAGSFLPDSGVKQAYISSPDVPTSNKLPPTTSYKLNLPNSAAGMAFYNYNTLAAGVVGEIVPSTYYPTRTTTRVFINTGSHFWNGWETSYDADFGFYGIKAI